MYFVFDFLFWLGRGSGGGGEGGFFRLWGFAFHVRRRREVRCLKWRLAHVPDLWGVEAAAVW